MDGNLNMRLKLVLLIKVQNYQELLRREDIILYSKEQELEKVKN